MEYTSTMKPGMAGQGLMKVLALNLSEHIAFFLSSHTESIIFRSSSQVKGRRLNFNWEKTFGMDHLNVLQEGTSRQRSGKGAIRKRFPLQKPRREKTKLTIRHLYHETYRKPNEQLFSQYVATQLP